MQVFCPHCGFGTEELLDCRNCGRTGCEKCIEKSRLGWICSNCRINKINTNGPENAIGSFV